MRMARKLLAILFTCCAAADSQVVPSATGPGGPLINGNLHYTFRYSQLAEFGSGIGDWQTANASADVDYANDKERHPFSLNYTGGYTWTIAGPSYTTGMFQRLLLSQGLAWRKWSATMSDDVSYSPQAPTTGFSGIPGIGEPIGGSNPLPPSSQSILTVNTHVVDNIANIKFEERLNYATTLSAGGSSELRRYPDINGLDVDTLQANGTIARRLNARNSLTGNYEFSHFAYPDYRFTFTSNSALFGFTREWNRKITTDISAGPQWINSSNSGTMPPSTNVTVNANASYQFRMNSAGLTYLRTSNDGAGYLFGARFDTVSANFSRDIGRKLTVGLEASYRRTAGLQNNGVTNSKYGGGQVTRRLGRYFTAFANYTAMDQSSSSTLSTNSLNGLMQVVSFGVGYSPREMHLRH